MSEKVDDHSHKKSEDNSEYEIEDLEKAQEAEDATRKRRDDVKLRIDTGEERVRFRRRWFQIW